MTNTELLNALGSFIPVANHVVQVASYSGLDKYGSRALNSATTRQYRCLIQNNESTRWNVQSGTDDFPYLAYMLSVPIGQSDAVPVRVEEQFSVVTPSYWASSTPRTLGEIKSYFDEYGNLFCMTATFR